MERKKLKLKKKVFQLRFDTLENAFDFIDSALDYIKNHDKTRTKNHKNKSFLKYAVLHLSSGMELVLKERLRREHWALLFDNVNNANFQKFETGDFQSVTIKQSIDRLNGICKVSITQNEYGYFKKLRDKRNCLEHFGHLDPNDTYDSLKASVAKVLSLLIDFVKKELEPENFKPIEKMLWERIQGKLREFDVFVAKRLKEIDSKLKEAKSLYFCSTCYQETGIVFNENFSCLFCHCTYAVKCLECPECHKYSFFCRDGSLSCSSCGYSDYPEKVARKYIENVLHESKYLCFKDGGVFPLYECYSCEQETLVDSGDSYICFACGDNWESGDLEQCIDCHCLFPSQDEGFVGGRCPSCFNYFCDKND